MKRIQWFFLLISLFALLSSCTNTDTDSPLIPRDYSGWEKTVEEMLTYEIPGHTLDARVIYINDKGTEVAAKDVDGRISYDYPTGTVFLKENYPTQDSQDVDNYTVMIKDPTHPKSRGGWVWVLRIGEDGKERIFEDEFCFTCHQNANERHPYGDKNADREFRDYVFYPWTEEKSVPLDPAGY